MAIVHSIPTSYKVELLSGIHAFGNTVARAGTTPDTFKVALYTSAANLNETTTVYTTAGEVSNVGTNYTAGGLPLTVTPPNPSGTVAIVDFNDLTFSAVTVVARGGMIYNQTQGNRAVGVMDFGEDKTAIAGDFVIIFPSADPANAIIRII